MSHLIKNIVISIACCNFAFATEILLYSNTVQHSNDQIVLFDRDSPRKKSRQEQEHINRMNTILSDPSVIILGKKYGLAFDEPLQKELETKDVTIIQEVLRQIDRLKERTEIFPGVEWFFFELHTRKGEKKICVSSLLGENAD